MSILISCCSWPGNNEARMSNVETIDRVLVMSNRPATIQEIIDVDLPRPGYLEKRNRIFRVIGMSLRVGEIAV
jgi:hypothetical protein